MTTPILKCIWKMSNECICKDKLVPPLINRINLGLHAKVFVREIFLSLKKKKKKFHLHLHLTGFKVSWLSSTTPVEYAKGSRQSSDSQYQLAFPLPLEPVLALLMGETWAGTVGTNYHSYQYLRVCKFRGLILFTVSKSTDILAIPV